MKLKNFLIPAGIILAGYVVFAVMSKLKPDPPKKPVEIKPTLVETLTIKTEDIHFQVTTQGTVQPRTESTLVAEISGVIKKVAENYVVGGYFKKGDVIMQISTIDYEIALKQSQARHAGDKARLAQEKARVKQAEKEWALSGRAKKDAPALALRIPNLEEALANVNASAADLRNAELRLERTSIRAPYDGMVKTKLVDIGQYVNVGTQLVQAFAVDYAEVRLPLSNSDLQFLKLPKPGTISSRPIKVILTSKIGNEEHQWQGLLNRSEGRIDPKSRVYYGVVQINDPYGLNSTGSEMQKAPLNIGSFVTAEIEGFSMSSIVKLPRTALKGDNKILLMDSNNKLKLQEIEITRVQDDWIYIQQGLKNGDKVVLTALETAIAGMLLRDQHYQPGIELSKDDSQLEPRKESKASAEKVETDKLSPLSQ